MNEIFQNSARDPYLYAPTDFATCDEYLDFLDAKANDWSILLANPTQEQINIFRTQLVKNYKNTFSHRTLLSIIIHANISTQPWALFALEIEQHESNLNNYKSNFNTISATLKHHANIQKI